MGKKKPPGDGAGKPAPTSSSASKAAPGLPTASERKQVAAATAEAVVSTEQSSALAHWIIHDLESYRRSVRGRQRMRSPADQRDALRRIAVACKTAAQEINKQLQAASNAFDSVPISGIYLDRAGDTTDGFKGLVAQLRSIADKTDGWAEQAMGLRAENLHNEHSAVFMLATRWAQITRSEPASNRAFKILAISLLGLFEGSDARQNSSQSVAQGLRYWSSCGRGDGEFDILPVVKQPREK